MMTAVKSDANRVNILSCHHVFGFRCCCCWQYHHSGYWHHRSLFPFVHFVRNKPRPFIQFQLMKVLIDFHISRCNVWCMYDAVIGSSQTGMGLSIQHLPLINEIYINTNMSKCNWRPNKWQTPAIRVNPFPSGCVLLLFFFAFVWDFFLVRMMN